MNLKIEIKAIKNTRDNFIESFNINDKDLEQNIKHGRDNDILNSIRIHKYITSSKEKGKVESARFLESINLTEKTILKELTNEDIDNIVNFLTK
jgi:hypothetical protein